MRYNSNIMHRLLLLALLTLVVATSGVPFAAQALTISPVKMELEVEPGETIGSVFELYNEETVPRTLFVSYENFEPSGDLGTPRFIGAEEGLATWITATPEVVLASDERITVPFTIKVPADTKPGGYFAAVFYGGQNPNTTEGGEVAIGGKLGMLILLRVKGDITEEGGINQFGTQDGQRLFSGIPVTFITQMTNRGGDRIVPRGGITVSNIFGMEVTRLEVNKNEGSILPNSSRTFSEVWSGTDRSTTTSFFGAAARQWNDFHVGAYRAQAELVWGSDANTSTASYWIIILPWQLIILLSFGLLAVLLVVRKYNTYIIARAKKI
jgi:hypothetical protein